MTEGSKNQSYNYTQDASLHYLLLGHSPADKVAYRCKAQLLLDRKADVRHPQRFYYRQDGSKELSFVKLVEMIAAPAGFLIQLSSLSVICDGITTAATQLYRVHAQLHRPCVNVARLTVSAKRLYKFHEYTRTHAPRHLPDPFPL